METEFKCKTSKGGFGLSLQGSILSPFLELKIFHTFLQQPIFWLYFLSWLVAPVLLPSEITSNASAFLVKCPLLYETVVYSLLSEFQLNSAGAKYQPV